MWHIVVEGGRLKVTDGWICDWPIRYPDGRIAYDRPEIIPEYAKRAVTAWFAVWDALVV